MGAYARNEIRAKEPAAQAKYAGLPTSLAAAGTKLFTPEAIACPAERRMLDALANANQKQFGKRSEPRLETAPVPVCARQEVPTAESRQVARKRVYNTGK